MSEHAQYCTFRVHNLFLGIDVQRVQEVIRSLEMTSVPLAPRAVQGLINLRGQIVTAIDLRDRLELPPRAEADEPMHVVIRSEGGAVSLMVDAIDDVVNLDSAHFEDVPSSIAEHARALLTGVCKLDRQLLLVLNTEQIVAVLPDS